MVVGIVLIVLGVLFILLSLVAAARSILLKSNPTEPTPAGLGALDPEKWQKFLEAITSFVKVAPQWLLMSVVGAGLIAWGTTLLD
jgi:hypothetical protein